MRVVLMRSFDASEVDSLLELTVDENAKAEVVGKSIESDCFLLRVWVHLLEESSLYSFLGDAILLDFFGLKITLESDFDGFLNGVFDEHCFHAKNL
jgi:hypothetical protein